MKNNKGFSLVELMVVIAILGIVSGAVLGLIIAGTRSYRNVNKEAELQNEAQLTMNQIENMIIDATNGVSYYWGDNEGNKILADDEAGEATKKTLVIYNKNEILNITWKKDMKELYFRKDEKDPSSGAITKGKEALMSQRVERFSINLKNAKKKGIVTVFLFFKTDDNKTYELNQNITMRNTTVVNGKLTDVYPDEEVVISTVTSVSIFDGNVDCTNSSVTLKVNSGEGEKGSITFSSLIKGIGYPSQDVIWTVDGNSDKDTSIMRGKLSIGANETNSSVRVIATSKQDPTISAYVDVLLNSVNGITVSVSGHSGDFYKGDIFFVTAFITGTNLTDNDKAANWSFSGVTRDTSYPTTSLIQKFIVTAEVGQKVTVKATCKMNSNLSAEIDPIIVKKTPYVISLNKNRDSTTIGRGESVEFWATYSPNDSEFGNFKWVVEAYIHKPTWRNCNKGNGKWCSLD